MHVSYQRRFLIYSQSKLYSKQILGLVNRVGTNVEKNKELYEKPSILKAKSLFMVIDRQVPSRIGDRPLGALGSKVTLPSTQELIGGNSNDINYLSSQVSLLLYFVFKWS